MPVSDDAGAGATDVEDGDDSVAGARVDCSAAADGEDEGVADADGVVDGVAAADVGADGSKGGISSTDDGIAETQMVSPDSILRVEQQTTEPVLGPFAGAVSGLVGDREESASAVAGQDALG